MRAGGIDCDRSFCTTFSHTSARSPTCSRSAGSSTNPPVLSLALWQVVQYLVKTSAGAAEVGAAEQVRAMEPATNTANNLPTYLIYYTQIVVRQLRLLTLFVFLMSGLKAADLRLIDAVKNTDTKAVRSLLALHADVNATEADGFTALHWAAQRDNL